MISQLRRHYRRIISTLVIAILIGFYGVTPLVRVYMATHPYHAPVCCTTPKDRGLQYQDVTFTTPDGLTLAGWYIPSRNHAAIILSHGYGGNRLGVMDYAEVLAHAGFGVLVYDERDQGNNPASLCTRGWLEVNDVIGGVNYLRARPDVDPAHICAFGFSIGGQITLRAAALTPYIAAVGADGASTATFDDEPPPNT